jgi:hypothetical protein
VPPTLNVPALLLMAPFTAPPLALTVPVLVNPPATVPLVVRMLVLLIPALPVSVAPLETVVVPLLVMSPLEV